MEFDEINHHASAVIVGVFGILIRGKSGAGKTSLALRLIEDANSNSCFACLVADDQVCISALNGRIIARRPPSIASMAEIRGLGIVAQKSVVSAVIHLIVDIVEPDKIPRLPDLQPVDIGGVKISRIKVPRHREIHAARMIIKMLDSMGKNYGCTP